MKMLITLLFLLTSAIYASTDDQYWSSIKLSSKIDEKFSLKGEFIHRYSNDRSKFVTRSNRLGIGYKFWDNTSYTFLLENRRGSSSTSNEIRFLHQLSHKIPFEKISLGLRGRWEWREFSNTPEFAHRLRARVKVDGTGFKFYKITPFVFGEYFYGPNEVRGRADGHTELRLQSGGSFNALGGKVSLSYLRRQVWTPAYQGSAKSDSKYSIIDLGLGWKF